MSRVNYKQNKFKDLMKMRKSPEKPETTKISGKENNHKICEQKTIDSVKKPEDLMKIQKNPEKYPEKEIIRSYVRSKLYIL